MEGFGEGGWKNSQGGPCIDNGLGIIANTTISNLNAPKGHLPVLFHRYRDEFQIASIVIRIYATKYLEHFTRE
jgi:hypothetical protein